MKTDNQFLIDGKYSFKDLVDINRLREMFESFSRATGFTTGLISHPEQEILIATGWRDICTQFHRACPDSAIHCKQSNIELAAHLKTQKELSIRRCANGLVDGATPIIVHGTHVANLATGQILFNKPDKEWFRKQGKAYGYDLEAYLASLDKVPVVTEEAFKNALTFLSEMSIMLAEQSLATLQNRQLSVAARENEEQLRITLNSIGDAVVATDANGRVTMMNPVAEHLTGWKATEAFGKNLHEILHIINAHTREPAINPLDQVLKSGKTIGLANHTILISKNGAEYQIADSAAPIIDNEGCVRGVILVFRDVSEKYRLEEAQRDSEDQLNFAMETSLIGVWTLNLKDHSATRSLIHDQIFGYTNLLPHWSYETFLEHVLPEDRTMVDHHFQYAIANHSDWNFECRIRRVSGEERWIWAAGRHQFSHTGAAYRMAGIVQDITERKRAETELQKMHRLTSVGTLAGGIAHDFNNILMGLFGNISLVKSELPTDHPGFKPLENAEKSMFRAILLTKQLLTFSKGGDPVKEDVSLGTIVEEVTRFDLSGSNVKLVYRQTDDLWSANVDKGQIMQVISNITINAREAMPNGGHLYITLENTQPGPNKGNYIKVTIRDEGTGIDPKIIDRIFDPYFTTKHSGNGLGLATSYSIIHKHGGHIDVASELGIGTTFTLYLPASKTQLPPERGKKVASRLSLNPSLKVLILDDDDMIRTVIPRWLQKMGCSATACPDGRQAIDLYKESLKAGNPFDILILDLTLPGGLGGQEVLREILAIAPKARAIVSSGYADSAIMASHKAHGFKGVLAKPYTKEQLQEVLEDVLNLESCP